MPPPTFVFVREGFPKLAKELQAKLRKIGYPDLAVQVPDLRIYGRCPCETPDCGTFYCVPREEYARLARASYETGAEATVAKGKIIRVETLDSEVDAVLKRLFPEPDTADLDT